MIATFSLKELRTKGGAGSGNFGHSGRPGKIGGSAGGIKHETSAPSTWKERVELGVNSIPAHVRNAVDADVVTVDVIYDGLDVKRTELWDKASGGFDVTANKVVVAYKTSTGNIVDRCDAVARHEYGHAVDKHFGINVDAKFRATYEAEKQAYIKLTQQPADPNTGMKYPNMDYFTNGTSGSREFVAEAVAYMYGGAPTFGASRMFPKFPNSVNYIKNVIGEK